ncbi:MAG TPA: hypothetical protein VK034_08555, partial [Enhygromyxa sp.]|nr:hypothetical protein [Enhygromyxa sp.]
MKQPRGTWRGLIAVALSLSMGLGVGACKSGNAAQKLATSTAPTLEGSTGKCKPGNEGSKSLVVEWPMGERAALEGRVQRGLVAVRYRNCEMELITNCSVSGHYDYIAVTPKSENVKITNADELYAKIPIGAVRLEGQLARAGELNVDMIQVGRHESDRFHFNQADLSGRCEGATHVVTGLSVGAFVFYSGAGADIGLSGSATGTGISAGAGSTASKEVLNRDGDMAACVMTEGLTGPPPGCSALLRVEVVPIDFPQPTTSSGGTTVTNLTQTNEVAGEDLTTSELDRRIKALTFAALSGYLVTVSGVFLVVFGIRINAGYNADTSTDMIGQPGSADRTKFVSRYNASLGM